MVSTRSVLNFSMAPPILRSRDQMYVLEALVIHHENRTDISRLVQTSDSQFTSPGRLEQLPTRRIILAFLRSHFLERLALRQLGTPLQPIPIIAKSMQMRPPTSPTTLSRPGSLTFQMMYVIRTLPKHLGLTKYCRFG